MRIRRREFISLLSITAVGELAPSARLAVAEHGRIKAIAFDAFVIFDPRPIAECTEELLPGRGKEFTDLWHTRQFEYTWLRTIGKRYKDFWQVTEDALNHAASEMKVSLTKAQREHLMDMYKDLPPWPDAPGALAELRRRNVRIAFLSNFSADMLHSNLAAAELDQYFEPHMTTDRVRVFKPSPVAYGMGPDHFALKLHEIAFVAFAPWDAIGAKWFGYSTIWVNRLGMQLEHLDIQPDAIASNLKGVPDFLDQHS